tara:strand:- start:325 stop:1092 length:768 start_codon:yes stop_codon:yes gene_type:complete
MAEANRVVINEPTENEEITLEQQAEMQEEAAATSEEQTPNEERPEWLDEKFNSPEDLAKAYNELQKKLSETNKEAKEEEVANEETPSDNIDSSGAVGKATLEFEEKGELSEETFAELEKAGLPKEYVESYIAGQQALVERNALELYNSIGGEEEYDGMIQWAGETLSEGEVETFNELVVNGTPEQQRLAIKGLHAQYRGATGSGPLLKQGNTSGNSVKPFSSTKELQRAMSDRRYAEVPSYREEVERRLSVSNIL